MHPTPSGDSGRRPTRLHSARRWARSGSASRASPASSPGRCCGSRPVLPRSAPRWPRARRLEDRGPDLDVRVRRAFRGSRVGVEPRLLRAPPVYLLEQDDAELATGRRTTSSAARPSSPSAARRRARAHELPARQPRRAQARIRHGRRERRARRDALPRRRRDTVGGRGRSTRRSSRSGRTSRRPRARSSTATG